MPEEVTIVNTYKQATEKVMFQKQALFKIYESNDKNLFPIFFKFAKKIYIGKNSFYIA
jgi:hypothetical protein